MILEEIYAQDLPESTRKKWLELSAEGDTAKQIAKKYHCDARTVKAALEGERSSQAGQEALTQLYKDALHKHMNGLNASLEGVIAELRVPEPFVTEISISQSKSQRCKTSSDFDSVYRNGNPVEGEDDPLSDNALLAEHLKNSRPARELAEWRRSINKHQNACGQLYDKAVSVLKETTGLSACGDEEADTPLLEADNAGKLLCSTVIEVLTGIRTFATWKRK